MHNKVRALFPSSLHVRRKTSVATDRQECEQREHISFLKLHEQCVTNNVELDSLRADRAHEAK